MANGNGGSGRGPKNTDAMLSSAILDLCDGVKIEVIKMEGLAHAIMHRRIVPTKSFRDEFLASVRRVGQRHLDMVERVTLELAKG
jgi:hypothetical protein